MNCQCLQTIVDNNKTNHTIDDKYSSANHVIQIPQSAYVIFSTIVHYKHKEIHPKHGAIIDMSKQDINDILFIFCPICGTKTKIKITKKDYYAQFQKPIKK